MHNVFVHIISRTVCGTLFTVSRKNCARPNCADTRCCMAAHEKYTHKHTLNIHQTNEQKHYLTTSLTQHTRVSDAKRPDTASQMNSSRARAPAMFRCAIPLTTGEPGELVARSWCGATVPTARLHTNINSHDTSTTIHHNHIGVRAPRSVCANARARSKRHSKPGEREVHTSGTRSCICWPHLGSSSSSRRESSAYFCTISIQSRRTDTYNTHT